MNRDDVTAPGPWEYHDGKIYAADGDLIATLNHHPLYDTEKTGRLIAAAPELLKELEHVEWDYEPCGQTVNIRSIQEAILKAGGRCEML